LTSRQPEPKTDKEEDKPRELEPKAAEEITEPEKPEPRQEPDQQPAKHENESPVVQAAETSENGESKNRPPETVTEKPEKSEEIPVEAEEEEVATTKKTVGENFSKGKSLNDLMLENKTLDKKLASSSITKLETAIGLNDRFQYTRELFDNKPDLFRKTVQEIDQANNLDEAVAYLNSNFKWKKTETSIQFAQLVKRRFTK